VMPRECHLLLAVWCCLKVELDDVMRALAQFSTMPTQPQDLKRYKALISMRTTLTRQFGQLSSKLRLTPTHRLDAHRSPNVGNMPWEEKRQLSFTEPWSAGESEPEDLPPQQSLDARRAPNVNGKPWSSEEGQ